MKSASDNDVADGRGLCRAPLSKTRIFSARTTGSKRVARTVHHLFRCLFLSTCCQTGCVATPPIEAEPPDINLPPFIDPDRALPTSSIVTVTSSNDIVLEVSQLFDPNPEEKLFYAWIAEGGWISQIGNTPLSTDQIGLYKDAYYRFDGVQYAFNPCNADVRDKRSETIFLYVSDRPFITVTNTTLTPDPAGFLDAWSWVFQIQPGVCDG